MTTVARCATCAAPRRTAPVGCAPTSPSTSAPRRRPRTGRGGGRAGTAVQKRRPGSSERRPGSSETPERRIRRALDRFNSSEHRRTVAGLTRSLGNPRVAAITPVISTPDGEVLEQHGERIGEATNNVAEYQALLLGLERALSRGARQVELIGDSELVVRQVRGEYKVKDEALKGLYAKVVKALADFDSWSIRHVRREQNAEADRLVNGPPVRAR